MNKLVNRKLNYLSLIKKKAECKNPWRNSSTERAVLEQFDPENLMAIANRFCVFC